MSHLEAIERQRANRVSGDAAYDAEYNAHRAARATVVRQLRRASRDDYQRFLAARTDRCTHFYDYDFSRASDSFFIATDDVELPPLFGALSISVIALPGVLVTDPEWSHNSIFEMDNPNTGSWVPSYNDANRDERTST